MKSPSHPRQPASPLAAWLCVVVIGIAAPALALLLLAGTAGPAQMAVLGGTALAVGLMGVGMIGAAAAGSLGTGVLLALLAGSAIAGLALTLGVPAPLHPLSLALAVIIASLSFAVRGALFARSAGEKGWWIALFVVSGEVAVVATALALPDALPDWLLALLPAQWASTAIQTALAGTGTSAAGAVLFALAATAAATLLVVSLWPRRWPYLIMFTTWLACSALVWHRPAPPLHPVETAAAAAPEGGFSR